MRHLLALILFSLFIYALAWSANKLNVDTHGD